MKAIFHKHINKTFKSMMKAWKVKSIQAVITVSFTLITVCTLLIVGLTLYNKFSRTAEQNASLSTRQIIDQVNYNLDTYLRNMMDVSNLLYYNVIKTQNIPNSKLAEQMNVIVNTRKDIISLAVFSEKGEMITGVPLSRLKSNANVTGQEWFRRAVDQPENLYFSPPHVQSLFAGQHKWVVSLSRAVTLNKDGENIYGVMLVDMNFSAIEQLAQRVNLGSKGYIYITDPNGDIVYHNQQQLIYAGVKNENNYKVAKMDDGNYIETFNGVRQLITVKTVGYTGWKIIGISYMDEMVATTREIRSFVGWILVVGILFVIFISAFISYKISQPVKRLEESMKMVEEGHFDINIEVKGEDEVVQLSRAFNLMVARIKQLMGQVVTEQEAKRKSELEALQAQINPHFLYNTLDSIVWMAENEKTQDVITMVTALARLFRISISRGKNVITVREELEHARNYLIIQKRRYKDKFQFTIEAAEETLQYKTLKLILQPLIENAIYHGIEYMVDEGEIRITVSIVDGKLLYEVRDNGLGMKPEVMENILSKEWKKGKGSGVGMKNVHERIQLYYGKQYGLEIQSELEEGTTVKAWLPLVEEDERNENNSTAM